MAQEHNNSLLHWVEFLFGHRGRQPARLDIQEVKCRSSLLFGVAQLASPTVQLVALVDVDHDALLLAPVNRSSNTKERSSTDAKHSS